jgi:hypothetical protein
MVRERHAAVSAGFWGAASVVLVLGRIGWLGVVF